MGRVFEAPAIDTVEQQLHSFHLFICYDAACNVTV